MLSCNKSIIGLYGAISHTVCIDSVQWIKYLIHSRLTDINIIYGILIDPDYPPQLGGGAIKPIKPVKYEM